MTQGSFTPGQSDVIEVPSFVDSHSHDDIALIVDPEREVKARQGIGHQVIGNCGLTPFPLRPGRSDQYERFLRSVLGDYDTDDYLFADIGSFMAKLPDQVTVLAGYNSLRLEYFGDLSRPLRSEERPAMSGHLRRVIDEGATGVSIGLAYQPALYADRNELIAIAESTPLLTVHMRNESDRILDSIEEIAEAVESAAGSDRCHLHISHLKIFGSSNWRFFDRLLERVEYWHDRIGLTFDHYPFNFGSTGLAALLPPEISSLSRSALERVPLNRLESRLEDRDWENYVASTGPSNLILAGLVKNSALNGKSLERADTAELIRRLVIEEPNPVILIRGQSDAIIDELLKLPYGCIGSDALPRVPEHPRLFDTFPEYLRRMKSLGFSLEQAVEKASLLPRQIFKISNPSTVRLEKTTWQIC